jgi:hypothetical protein
MVSFDISQNGVTGTVPGELGRGWANTLNTFIIAQNHFNGTLPASFANCTQMVTFQVNNNNITGPLPEEYRLWGSSIDAFVVSVNNITGTLPDGYQNWSRVTIVSVDSNQLNGTLPASYRHWTRMSSFLVNANQLNGTLPESFSAWTSVDQVHFNDNYFSGTLPEAFSRWGGALTSWMVQNNAQISSTLPENYSDWVNLKTFDVHGCDIYGTLPAAYAAMIHMRWFSVHNCPRLSGPLPAQYSAMGNMSEFIASNCSFSGELPATYASWTGVTVLDVGSNNFIGTIPNSWKRLTSLSALTVSDNSLQGPIPTEILQLPLLTLFVASYNNLTATLTLTHSMMSVSLQVLMIQNNRYIRGVVPSTVLTAVAICGTSITTCPTLSFPYQYCVSPRLSSALTRLGRGVSITSINDRLSPFRSFECSPYVAQETTANASRAPPVPSLPTSSTPSSPATVVAAGVLISSVMVAQGVLLAGSGRFSGGTAVHSIQSALAARRKDALCAAAVAAAANTGSDSGSSGGSDASGDEPLCCDIATSPTRLTIPFSTATAPSNNISITTDSIVPQLLGAIIGNSVIVGCLTGFRLLCIILVRRFPKATTSMPTNTEATMTTAGEGNRRAPKMSHFERAGRAMRGMFGEKVGPIAAMWTSYTMLLSPVVGASVGLILLPESTLGLRFAGVVGIVVWVAPWGMCIFGLCWRRRRSFPFRGVVAKGRRLWGWLKRVSESIEQLVASPPSSSAVHYARELLQLYAPAFEGYTAHRFWYFNVELGLAVSSGLLTGISYSDAERNPCRAWTEWTLAALGGLEVLLALTVRPFPVLLDLASVVVLVGLATISQLLVLATDDPAAANAANGLTLLCSVIEVLLLVFALFMRLMEAEPWRNASIDALVAGKSTEANSIKTKNSKALRARSAVVGSPNTATVLVLPERQTEHQQKKQAVASTLLPSTERHQSLADLVELACFHHRALLQNPNNNFLL